MRQFQIYLSGNAVRRGVILNIPFWSNERRSGSTANLAAVSIMCTLKSAYRITLLENHYSEHNLGKMLLPFPKSHLVKEEVIYYLGHGISDCLVPRVVRDGYVRSGGPFLEILEERLYYMLQLQAAGDLFELEFTNTILPMLRSKKQEELWMIDTECNRNVSSKLLLDEAGLVVVTLQRKLSNILDFLKKYSEIKDKSIFLITDLVHSKNEEVSENYLNELLDRDQIVLIPNCPEFKEHIAQGRCIEFITSHAECGRNDPYCLWIQAVERAARLILEKCRKELDING